MKLLAKLSETQYALLKQVDLSELEQEPIFYDETKTVDIPDLFEFQLLLTEEIVVNGMDDEDTVNAYGRELYALYDDILDQKYDQLEEEAQEAARRNQSGAK